MQAAAAQCAQHNETHALQQCPSSKTLHWAEENLKLAVVAETEKSDADPDHPPSMKAPGFKTPRTKRAALTRQDRRRICSPVSKIPATRSRHLGQRSANASYYRAPGFILRSIV